MLGVTKPWLRLFCDGEMRLWLSEAGGHSGLDYEHLRGSGLSFFNSLLVAFLSFLFKNIYLLFERECVSKHSGEGQWEREGKIHADSTLGEEPHAGFDLMTLRL